MNRVKNLVKPLADIFDQKSQYKVSLFLQQRIFAAVTTISIAIGEVFFGESMFSRVSDASKVALVALSELLRDWNYGLIDCQIHNPHLASMGAHLLPRSDFLDKIALLVDKPPGAAAWQDEAALDRIYTREN